MVLVAPDQLALSAQTVARSQSEAPGRYTSSDGSQRRSSAAPRCCRAPRQAASVGSRCVCHPGGSAFLLRQSCRTLCRTLFDVACSSGASLPATPPALLDHSWCSSTNSARPPTALPRSSRPSGPSQLRRGLDLSPPLLCSLARHLTVALACVLACVPARPSSSRVCSLPSTTAPFPAHLPGPRVASGISGTASLTPHPWHRHHFSRADQSTKGSLPSLIGDARTDRLFHYAGR